MPKSRNVYFNPNPMKHEVGDCTVRACCVATGKNWDEVYRALCDIGFELKRMPNDRECVRAYKNADGTKETDFIDIVAWRSSAEFVSKYFSKGRMAVVEGRLQMRDWTDKDGNKRRNAEVVVDNIYFGDSKRDNNNVSSDGYGASSGGYGTAAGGYSLPTPGPGGFAEIDDEDGDLPF